jgi:hypothetical protein
MLTVLLDSKKFAEGNLVPQNTSFTAAYFVESMVILMARRNAQQPGDATHGRLDCRFDLFIGSINSCFQRILLSLVNGPVRPIFFAGGSGRSYRKSICRFRPSVLHTISSSNCPRGSQLHSLVDSLSPSVYQLHWLTPGIPAFIGFVR